MSGQGNYTAKDGIPARHFLSEKDADDATPLL